MRSLILTLSLVVFIFSGCYKDASNYNYYNTAPEIEPLVFQDGFNPPFHRSIVLTKIAMFQLLTTIFREMVQNPELFNIAGPASAVTRACPDDVLNPPSGFPTVLTMTFDNCTSNGLVYDGVLDVNFSAALDVPGSTITVDPFTGVSIGACTFDSPGTISLTRTDLLTYGYTLDGAVTSTDDNNITTSVPSGTTGSFSLIPDGAGGNDDFNDPSTFIDNEISFTLDDTPVTCSDGVTSMSFCTNTSEDIVLDPLVQVCPSAGTLQINNSDSDCSAASPSNCNATVYTFETAGEYSSTQLKDFISYEGSLTPNAGEGPAAGCPSTDTDVEYNNENITMQLSGNQGSSWFTGTESAGDLNPGQVIMGSPTMPWINEISYDPDGVDGVSNLGGLNFGDYVEIAGPAGLDLSVYKIVKYNGANGNVYGMETLLSGMIDDEGAGFGAIHFDVGNIQNGRDDGLALVRCVEDESLSFCN